MSKTSDFWSSRSVVVTGGAGFFGGTVVKKLQEHGAQNIFVPRSKDYDLTEISQIQRLFKEKKPDVVIHMAALCGGIGANRAKPGEFFYKNAIMGIQLIEVARQMGVKKTTIIGTICAYPKDTPVPFREEDLWNGYPEETNGAYGIAKKMLLVQSQAYRQEYGLNSIYLLPVNLYGPNDNFDLETSHVIPGMIRKFIEARDQGKKEVTFWGTGTITREFVFVEDAAEAVVLASELYNGSDPVNVGSGMEISIRDLAEKIKKILDFKGDIKWDHSRPDGQPKRRLSVERAKKLFGFQAKVTLDEGLKKTIDWYQSSHALKI